VVVGMSRIKIAAFTEQVIAYDITPEMVNLVTKQSQQKGFDHVVGQVGAAEQLDFPVEHFDCVISRYSAHHWQSITQALHEIYRVLRAEWQSDPCLILLVILIQF
jgi:ubiquinone/menaquinone biosynthesis C-methylase UbiE